MRVGIIGCGATGLLTAGFLDGHHEVFLYGRREFHTDKLNRDGFILEIQNEMRKFHIQAALARHMTEKDLMMICVKQPDLPNVIEMVKKFPEMPLFFMQNGMGHEELAMQLKNPIYVGVSEHGACRKDIGRVAYNGAGRIIAGCLQGDRDEFTKVIEALNNPDYPFDISEDIAEIQKMKLLANAVINPITAVFRVKNGCLLENKALKEFAKSLCLEAAEVLCIDQSRAWKHCSKIAEKTAANRSSMLQDIEAGRKTEVDSILGYLMKKGRPPTIGFFLDCIKALESLAIGEENE